MSTSNRTRALLVVLALIVIVPLVILALLPPIQFDETMYHLPLVHVIARDGLDFRPELRFPVFPLLCELLAVPLYLVGGDSATHILPLIAALLTAVVLVKWGKLRGTDNGWLAAAAFLGAPIIVHLATSLYVETTLALCVATGFYCIEKTENRDRWLFIGGLFLGAACSVKYLGLYFAGVAFLRVRRLPFVLGVLVLALPMYAWIYAESGNPLFPFFSASDWNIAMNRDGDHLMRFLRIPYDIIFARDRAGFQPPYTPFFSLALLAFGWRSWSTVLYLFLFTFMPRDSRYLISLLPLVLIDGATRVKPMPRKLFVTVGLLALLPGPAYAIYRIATQDRQPYVAAALQRAGNASLYTCGGEQFKSFAPGTYLGDYYGPYSYKRVLGDGRDAARMHANLAALRLEMLLVVKHRCKNLALPAPGFTLIYEDANSQLWRVEPDREPASRQSSASNPRT
ncbi:MAG TPA: hypothetical protein VGQ76_14335 [Thermoanaerobaculia bacterium]|jgi:hypothetical protein|nr:hypothetical protein [Thermoanaerobaculia bacterium]